MAYLGKRSLINLSQATWDLQKVAQKAIQIVDFSIICCYRGFTDQMTAYKNGDSRAIYGESPHNVQDDSGVPALDFVPYPFDDDWENPKPFGFVKLAFEIAVAELKENRELPQDYELVYGLDWGWDAGHIEEKDWDK